MKEKFSFLKDKKNRKIVINIVAVIALLCIAVGISFAGGYWSYTSSNDNTLESGSVSLTYLESTCSVPARFPHGSRHGCVRLWRGFFSGLPAAWA